MRIGYLDHLRILAMLMIICMHSPMPGIDTDSLVLSSVSFLTAPGIGLFFMVSGALLLPTEQGLKDFMRHRLGKVAGPTIFWSLFFLTMNWIRQGTSLTEAIRSIASIPICAQGNGIMWFMYTLIGLYLLAPIISPWLLKASQKELAFVLALWGITMCYPLLEGVLYINDTKTGLLYYESGFAGYFILGYYLRKYHQKVRLYLIAFLLVIPLLIAIYVKTSHIPVDFYRSFWYLSILTAMMAMGWFLLFQQSFKESSSKMIALVSNCCFGIYFVHIIIMRQILWKWSMIAQYGGIAQILLTVVLTAVLSFVIVYAISFLPFAKYVIGFRQGKT